MQCSTNIQFALAINYKNNMTAFTSKTRPIYIHINNCWYQKVKGCTFMEKLTSMLAYYTHVHSKLIKLLFELGLSLMCMPA